MPILNLRTGATSVTISRRVNKRVRRVDRAKLPILRSVKRAFRHYRVYVYDENGRECLPMDSVICNAPGQKNICLFQTGIRSAVA